MGGDLLGKGPIFKEVVGGGLLGKGSTFKKIVVGDLLGKGSIFKAGASKELFPGGRASVGFGVMLSSEITRERHVMPTCLVGPWLAGLHWRMIGSLNLVDTVRL